MHGKDDQDRAANTRTLTEQPLAEEQLAAVTGAVILCGDDGSEIMRLRNATGGARLLGEEPIYYA